MTNENEGGEFSQTVRKFESSFIRVPFEQFRRSFRMEMKVAEKDLPGLEALVKKHLIDNGGEVGDNVLKALRERSKGLEEKVKEYRGESKKFRERFLKRMKWVEEIASTGNYRTWSRGRLIRLIGDFLIRSGDSEIVKEIGKKRPEFIEEFDLELEEMREEVIKSLERKEINLGLQWCSDHRNSLKRISSDLEFKLRRQEFIEMIKIGEISGAIKIAKKHFPTWLETNYRDIREAMTLICWLPFLGKEIKWNNGLVEKYEELLSDGQWQGIKEQFKKDFITIYQVDQSCQLIKTVRTGLAVLKTRQCHDDDGMDSGDCESECPACSGPLKELAGQLPFGHFETTKIRCRITGKLVSEHDPPMALPNGQVYSESGLKMLMSEATGVLKCPVTGQSFLFSDARKCFFL